MHNNTNILTSLGAAQKLHFQWVWRKLQPPVFINVTNVWGIVTLTVETPWNQVNKAARFGYSAWLSNCSSCDIIRSLPLQRLLWQCLTLCGYIGGKEDLLHTQNFILGYCLNITDYFALQVKEHMHCSCS